MILVTGASGYVGGRLVPKLLEVGRQVRVLARDPDRLQGRSWSDQVEIVRGDALKPETLAPAMAGVTCAYYMIHSMQKAGAGDGAFQKRDEQAAKNFSAAAKAAGVQRIIYLGGLGDPNADLSPHLRSRHQTGDALREGGVPVTEFRAAVIVGSGSVSFEMIRNLTERLPVMICPSWVYTRVQPIGIRNVVDYLAAAPGVPESAGLTIEIGGADVLTYADMMHGYAKARGLKRILIPVPLLTPTLSSYWVHWMTPIPAEIGRPLIEGLRNEVIVRDDTAARLFPDIKPIDYRTAVDRALAMLNAGHVESTWSDALSASQRDEAPLVYAEQEGMLIERRQQVVTASPARVFKAFTSIGGATGYPSFNWAWRIRGIVDRLFGGVGYRRGRRSVGSLRVGDVLDFWRVEAVDNDRLLRLRAEMKVPGRAWLQFEAQPHESGQTMLVQTAFFAPKGLAGLLYWYTLYPMHGPLFKRMAAKLGRSAMAPET